MGGSPSPDDFSCALPLVSFGRAALSAALKLLPSVAEAVVEERDPTDGADGALLGLLRHLLQQDSKQIHSSFIQGHHLLFCSREGGGCSLQVGVEGPHLLLVELGLCL